MGFVKNAHDICVFNRIEPNGSQILCVTHVDDMMITCVNTNSMNDFIDSFEKLYPGLTICYSLRRIFLSQL